MDHKLSHILNSVDRSLPQILQGLSEWLGIKSISADPAYKDECLKSALWLKNRLNTIGFETKLCRSDKGGNPAVLATYRSPDTRPGKKHILFYGHYDVQPVDPVELWHSDPFKAQIVEGPHGERICARGSADDKGQIFAFIEACRLWQEAGGIPVDLTLFIEGEEESGSPHFEELVTLNKEALKADFALVSDTDMPDINTPAVTTSLRGLVSFECTLKGPSYDLHSGVFGGISPNPLNALTALFAKCFLPDGRVAIPHFYDDIIPLSDRKRRSWAKLNFDEQAFLDSIGVLQAIGSQELSFQERLWAQPSFDLNGIWGGYSGPGGKTVIPSEAHAKFSCRLAPGQNPEKMIALIKNFLLNELPFGTELTFTEAKGSAGSLISEDETDLHRIKAVLSEEFQQEAVETGTGGTIPVSGIFRDILGINTFFVGFGLPDDRIHSPNEKFEVRCLQRAVRSHCRILKEFGGRG